MRLIRRVSPPPYVMQEHAGILLAVIGLIALITPATQKLLTLPWPFEFLMFFVNFFIGLGLCFARKLSAIKTLLFAAFAACLFTAIAYTFGVGVNTATGVYLVEAYFLHRLISRVKADLVQHVP